MFGTLTIALLLAAGLGPAITSLARELARPRRVRADGLGGTQDIAMIGSMATLACLIGAAACGWPWFSSR